MKATRSRVNAGRVNQLGSRSATGALFPKPTLQLDFVNQVYKENGVSKSFADLITFTRSTPGTCYGPDGLIQIVPANTPRFEYDPVTNEPLGIISEEPRVNLLLNSGDIGGQGWSSNGASSIQRNAGICPDGSNYASLISNTGQSNPYIFQGIAVNGTQTFSLSVYAKQNKPGDILSLRLFELGGASGNQSQTSPAFQLTDRWQRFTFTATLLQADRTTAQFILLGGANGGQALVWGAQTEVGQFPTSLITTGNTTANRNNELARVTDLLPWFNPQEGTLLVEVDFTERASNTWFAAFTQGTALQDVIDIGSVRSSGTSYSRTRVLIGGSTSAIRSGVDPLQKLNKLAVAYGKGFMHNSTNGRLLSNPLAGVPTVNVLGVGNIGGYQYSPGIIRGVTYYPKSLSQAALRALTK